MAPKKNKPKIIGRSEEQKTLKEIFQSNKSQFLALYGRRRVGKTFLIKNFFEQAPCVFFHVTGIQHGSLKDQLKEFTKQIGNTFYRGIEVVPSQNWLDAFGSLTKAMETLAPNKKIVLFFDEFPWMATRRSRMMQALEYYWNRYWDHDQRVKLIICGSSASWIIQKIINNIGGLYNRVTRTMRLSPFTLHETKKFLSSLGIPLSERQVLDLYMVIGGIPHYLVLLKRGYSASQSIELLFFQKGAALFDEFSRLFASLFQESETYINLIRMIGCYRYGISQSQLMQKKGVSEGGRVSQKLKELEDSGFISSFIPYGHHEKGKYYKIVDEYTLFYLHWIEPFLKSTDKQSADANYWTTKSQSASWKSWAGLAFEAVCDKHVSQISKALHIPPGSNIGSWRYTPKSKEENGTQIDLLFDRPDKVITLCEIKHSEKSFSIDKEYAQKLKRKIEIYRKQTRTRKDVFLAMIVSSGLKPSKYSDTLVSQTAELEDLFKP